MNWYLEVLKKYAVFQGRARRKEYWMFFLFNSIIGIALGGIDIITGIPVLALLYGLAVALPQTGVGVRRLHDTGRSGWWLLIAIVPLIGTIVLFVYLAQNSQADDNQYGANPKTASTALTI